MDLNISISYSNDLEYQTILLCIFCDSDLNSSKELENDLENVNFDKGLEFILNKTDDNPIFTELYTLAAFKMFSENHDIGLVILLSYDFLMLFYPLLVEYIHNGTINYNNLNLLKQQLHNE